MTSPRSKASYQAILEGHKCIRNTAIPSVDTPYEESEEMAMLGWDADYEMSGDDKEGLDPPYTPNATADTSQREVFHRRTLRSSAATRARSGATNTPPTSSPPPPRGRRRAGAARGAGPHPPTCPRRRNPPHRRHPSCRLTRPTTVSSRLGTADGTQAAVGINS